jgi:large subunit ribosomal protein L19
MSNLIKKFQEDQVNRISSLRKKSDFVKDVKIGDTVNVSYTIREGLSTRVQAFKGTVIARSKSFSNYAATFTVRKISSNVGVERKFTFYSPLIVGIEVLKMAVVRRAKLYYLRKLTGKASRIEERLEF